MATVRGVTGVEHDLALSFFHEQCRACKNTLLCEFSCHPVYTASKVSPEGSQPRSLLS